MRAHVGHDPRADCQHGSVTLRRKLDLLQLSAAVPGNRTVLPALLDPLHRSPQPSGGRGHGDLFTEASALATETSANVTDDDPEVFLVDAEAGGHRFAHPESGLRGDLQRQALIVQPRQRAARLQCRWDQSLVQQSLADDHLGAVERPFDRTVTRGILEGQVGSELRIEQLGTLLQGPLHIRDRWQRVEIQLDQFERIAGLRCRLGNQHRQRLTNVTHAAAGQHAPLRNCHPVDRRLDLERLQVDEVRGRPEGNHAGRL